MTDFTWKINQLVDWVFTKVAGMPWVAEAVTEE